MVEVAFLIRAIIITMVGASFIDLWEGPFPGEVPASCARGLDLALGEDPYQLHARVQPIQPAPDSS